MNWLDIVIIIVFLIGILHGLKTGIVKQVISLIALVAAILLSGALANWIHSYFHPFVQEDNSWFSHGVQFAIYYVIAFILIISLFSVFANLVDKIINFTPVGIINKLFGAIFGLFMWVLCMSILLNFIALFDTHSQLISQTVKENSIFYNSVKTLFPSIFPFIRDLFVH
jgi:membrane protein required for colicin V production